MFKKLHELQGRVLFFVDDDEYEAREDDTVLSALLASGIKVFCRSSVTASARGPYCGIGVCFDCLLTIEGEGKTQACLTVIRNEMRIRTGEARRDLLAEPTQCKPTQ
jgi:sarcosine oxidase subunit alpha